ncbi:miraculin-like [Prosopis cineraria]|uniref:miraculin-like n=1 Tax=Prosopis cineraria TaxID=364024 RepID=UPI00240F27F8|nr:miraculin-like [Prosopis cineraria]
MKIPLLSLILLFVALSTKPLLGAAAKAPEAVVDTLGKKLLAGSNYHIIAADPSQNGVGITVPSSGECILHVVVAQDLGLPISFTPVNPKKGVIRISTDLNIQFNADIDCPQSSVWRLDDYDGSTKRWFITTGGSVGNPGWQTVRNWFKIEKFEDAYKLVYCPSVCGSCQVQCKDIGLYKDKVGFKRLVLSDKPYKVQFQQQA